MTVVNIRKRNEEDYVEVVFLESARFFKLLKSNPKYEKTLRSLQDAMHNQQVLTVQLATPNSDVIDEVRVSD